MKSRILVDTSTFVDFFRSGDHLIIAELALQDVIVLSKIVRIELLKGTGRQDRKALLNFFGGLIQIEEIAPALEVEKLLIELQGKGFNLGIADLLILTDARRTKSHLMTSDRPLAAAAAAVKIPLFK